MDYKDYTTFCGYRTGLREHRKKAGNPDKKVLQTVDFFDIIHIWHILALQKAAPKVREEVKE